MSEKSTPCFLFLLLGLAISSQVQAGPCRPWQQEDSVAKDLVIGEITINANNIFDPADKKENRWYHRLANKLHIQTRREIIEYQLLFSRGDKYDERIIQETERLLRANRYIKDVTVRPGQVCGNVVDIVVKTNDNWTLTPGLSFGRAGGFNKYGLDIQEHNLMGYGKDLNFSFNHTIDRDERLLSYTDPLFMGTRKRLDLSAKDNSDGEGYVFGYTLPFYQLDSRKSWGVTATINKQETPLYRNGSIFRKIGEDEKTLNVFYGWSDGNVKKTATRYSVGWTVEEKKFSAVAPYNIIPATRKLSYPWVEMEYFEEKYTKKTNFSTMGIVEDISLGHHFKFKAGALTESMGSDNDYLYLSASYNKGYRPFLNQLGLLSLGVNSFVGNGPLEGVRVKGSGQWHYLQSNNSHFYLSGEFEAGSNLQAEEQITLGGDTGLRGYPVRYQSGNRAFLVTVEQRHFFDWYPFRTVRMGTAVFADAGAAWGQGNSRKVLYDVGVGLRFVITRSSDAKVLHLDFAFPIGAPATIDNFQVILKTKKSF